MPFVATLERESNGSQLFSVAIDDVDREKDRLVVRFGLQDEIDELVFALVDNDTGTNLLCLDRDNSDSEAVEAIHDGMREELGMDNPEQEAIYLVADTIMDSTDLMLTVPPSIELIIEHCSFVQELELEEGETVTVQSWTVD